ncbi:MAG TPA: hypothetical protein VFR02_04945 [bacterium]|nr:hypothetical protein [bacterium]
MAAIFMVLSTTLITTGVKLVSNAAREAKGVQTNVAEADNAARAGLEDALDYFIRNNGQMHAYTQSVQPGGTGVFQSGISYVDQPFSPAYNTNPKQSDTIDQTGSIGLVSEYGLDTQVLPSANLIARYEVRKQGPGAYDPLAVHDISGQRAVSEVNGDGAAWSVVSTGYVYKRLDHTYAGTYQQGVCPQWNTDYNQSPNQLVTKVTVSTEFRQVSLNLPTVDATTAVGAVYCDAVTQVHMSNSSTKISGAVTAGTNFAVLGMTHDH